MIAAALKENAAAGAPQRFSPVVEALSPVALTNAQTAEALAFLARRPLHTVCMSSLIRDNGLESRLNRGTFYACRDEAGEIVGMALIGHATLFETESEAAIAAFARLAQDCPRKHMLLGEQEKVARFWQYYSTTGESFRLVCRELLFEQCWPVEVREPLSGLRPATLEDLPLVMPVHAEMACEESGVNPLEVDPAGFRLRCARRIEQGRVWVVVENGRLLFKADIQADTPQAIYLEGIYVSPEERGKGYGARGLSQLSRQLLARSGSICLLVNENKWQAHALYLSVGYKLRGYYDTIFLH